MTDPKIQIIVAYEVDEDEPVADLFYDGENWASATFRDGRIVVTVYGLRPGADPVPIASMIETLERTRAQLMDICGLAEDPL